MKKTMDENDLKLAANEKKILVLLNSSLKIVALKLIDFR